MICDKKIFRELPRYIPPTFEAFIRPFLGNIIDNRYPTYPHIFSAGCALRNNKGGEL